MDRLNIKPQTFCDLVEIEETAPAWVTSTIIFYYSYSITTVTWIEQLSHNQITLRKLSQSQITLQKIQLQSSHPACIHQTVQLHLNHPESNHPVESSFMSQVTVQRNQLHSSYLEDNSATTESSNHPVCSLSRVKSPSRQYIVTLQKVQLHSIHPVESIA